MLRICIVGGGNLAHVCAGFLGSLPDVSIRILTRKPGMWSKELSVTDSNGKIFATRPELITDSPRDALSKADMVLFCLPGFAIREVLTQIKAYISSAMLVGTVVSSTGFFFQALEVLPDDIPLFGFQRVPFISRVEKYGHSANLLGYKSLHKIAIEQAMDKSGIAKKLSELFQGPFEVLENHLAVSLSNSNPLLHTARLYTMFKDGDVLYDKNPLFYADWTDEASETLIRMDAEFQELLLKTGLSAGSITPILEYYESHDAISLTRKIQSIPAFKTISSPMIQENRGYRIDLESRYFTEDFMFGLKYIYDLTGKYDIDAPMIVTVYNWGVSLLNQK